MNQRLLNWNQGLDKNAVDEYNALRRSLLRKDGFGLFFVRCSPAIGEIIIEKVTEDIRQKKIEALRLTESIDSLYDIIDNLPNKHEIDILFISGLEHSLYAYEKTQFKYNSKERYFYSWQGVARFLGYLNLQRDRFRDDNFNFSFVFLLPSFGINYFIRRAPDFFDWRSGLFEFIDQQEIGSKISLEECLKLKTTEHQLKLLETEALLSESNLTEAEKQNLSNNHFLLFFTSENYDKQIDFLDRELANQPDNDLYLFLRGSALVNLGRYEEAIESYDRALEIKPDDDAAWYNRGIALGKLGRYEEAIESYDRALAINPNYDSAWYNRGCALDDLGRYEEAIESYDRALAINPNYDSAWYNRCCALDDLGRYEEAIESYDRALAIKPDDDSAWYNRGRALVNLGRYEEAIESCDRALAIKPDKDSAWNNRGVALGNLGRYEEAIESYDRALAIKPDKDDAWYNRCWVLIQLKRYIEALESCDRAIELGEEHSSIFFNRAIAQLALNQWDKGIISLNDWLNLLTDGEKPDSGDIELIVGNLFNQKQERDVWKIRIATLLEIFDRHKVTSVLGQAIVKTIPTLMSEMISDKAAQTWLETWQELTENRHEFQIPLRLLNTAVRYKIAKGDRRVLLELAMEERSILEPLVKDVVLAKGKKS